MDNPRWTRRVLAVLAVSGAFAGLFFCLRQEWGLNSVLLLAASSMCLAGALIGSAQSEQGHLRWDVERWHWSGAQDHTVTQLYCVLDLQLLLLLQVGFETGPGSWLWLSSPVMDARWRALRRSVVAAGK